MIIGEVEVGEEAKGAECERKNRGNNSLKEPRCKKNSAISPKLNIRISGLKQIHAHQIVHRNDEIE